MYETHFSVFAIFFSGNFLLDLAKKQLTNTSIRNIIYLLFKEQIFTHWDYHPKHPNKTICERKEDQGTFIHFFAKIERIGGKIA